MKYLSKISLVVTVALTVILPVLAAVNLAGAYGNGSAALYLSPASNTVPQSGTLDLDIHEDSGTDKVNGAHVILNFSSNLTYAGVDNNPTDFPITALTTTGTGTVTIDRGTCTCGYQTGVTGDKVVATVHFKANTPGTGSVSFGSGSGVVSAITNKYEAMTLTGGTYTITPTGTMTLSPATKTVTKGDSFDVAVYEDSHTDSLNGVQANLSYNPSLLSVASITPNSSVWQVQAENSASNGLIKIGLGTTAPVTGSQLVATVKFTAAGAGNAQVAFTTGTGLLRSSDNSVEPSNNTGGSYVINSPSAPPSSGGTGSTKNTGTTSTKPLPPPKSVTSSPAAQSSPVTTPLDTTAPVISDIKVTNVTTKSATVSWTTSEPATSEVDFGLDTSYILSASDGALATNHSLALDSKELVGHKTYHFIVKSTDSAGNQAVSPDKTFSTGGIQITTTEIAIAAGAAVLGGGAWLMAAAGGLKLGGGMMAASGGGIYVEPKPIILGGGTPPPQPTPVIHPQSAAPAQAQTTARAPAKAPPASQEPQTPGKVVGPKSPPAAEADNQTLPKWVKK